MCLPASLHLLTLFPLLGMPFPQPSCAHAVQNPGWHSHQTTMVQQKNMESVCIQSKIKTCSKWPRAWYWKVPGCPNSQERSMSQERCHSSLVLSLWLHSSKREARWKHVEQNYTCSFLNIAFRCNRRERLFWFEFLYVLDTISSPKLGHLNYLLIVQICR